MNGCSRSVIMRIFGALMLVVCLSEPTIVEGSAPAAPEGGQVLFLHTEFLPYARNTDNVCSSRLMREMVRQAVLLAARDELGLKTRDETLQEEEPLQATVLHVMLIERANLSGKWNVKLVPYDGGEAWEKAYDYNTESLQHFADMIPKLDWSAGMQTWGC